MYGFRYDNFVVPLVKAVQELSKKNDSLNLKMGEFVPLISGMKIKNKALLKRIERLESLPNVSSQLSKTTTITNAILEQNFPNPANNITVIDYTLPQKFSTAQLIITDNNGKTIKQINASGIGKGMLNLNVSMRSAGTYNYSFEG